MCLITCGGRIHERIHMVVVCSECYLGLVLFVFFGVPYVFARLFVRYLRGVT